MTGLHGKFAGEPASGAAGADAAFGEGMLEAEEPGFVGPCWGRQSPGRGSGNDRRAFDVAGDCGAGDVTGHDRIDEDDLRERQVLVGRADGDFLANVVGAFAQDRRPGDANLPGRILEFDAQFVARQAIGGLG